MKKYVKTFLVTLAMFNLMVPMGMVHAIAGGVSTAKVSSTEENHPAKDIEQTDSDQEDIAQENDVPLSKQLDDGAFAKSETDLSKAEKDQIKLQPGLEQAAGNHPIWITAGVLILLFIWMESVYLNESPED